MSVSNGDRELPYFFLAYAHTPEQPWIARLYKELNNQILERTDWPTNQPAGFMDQSSIRHGADWRNTIDEALATCRVFVPLYSPRYFTRPECGREWNAFTSRVLLHGGNSPPIVPALWTPVEDEHVPPVARRIQADFTVVHRAYAAEGLYTLIKNRAYRNTYLKVVEKLAKQIIATARESAVGPCGPTDLDLATNAFNPASSPLAVSANSRLTVMVAAPAAGDLTGERGPTAYGERPIDWKPFSPHDNQVIGEVAAEISRSHDLLPAVVPLRNGLSLDWSRPETGMGVVLVDPWLSLDERASEQLARADELCAAGRIGAVVLWNSVDSQTAHHVDELRKGLQSRAPRCLGDPNVPATMGASHIHSLGQFLHEYPAVLDRAFNRFLNQAESTATSGDPGPMPTIWGADGETPASAPPSGDPDGPSGDATPPVRNRRP